ncbi:MAG: hypothetical protein PVJ75_11850 [Chloroflexota bacterium]
MSVRTVKVAILLGALILLAAVAQGQAVAQEGGRAGVVVRFADDRVESRCVAFDEDEISGARLLERSGLVLAVKPAGQGGLVCAIEGTGCGLDNCLCQCQGDPCIYWSYWRLGDDGWAYSGVGASIRRIGDGDVDGWSWGPGSVTSAIEPPVMSFDEICAAGRPVYDGLSVEETRGQEAGPTSWLPYVAFGLLLAVIGAGALLASRRRPGS